MAKSEKFVYKGHEISIKPTRNKSAYSWKATSKVFGKRYIKGEGIAFVGSKTNTKKVAKSFVDSLKHM